jgi:anti-sigma regulatory factor (Ser/Thr protein kinase)
MPPVTLTLPSNLRLLGVARAFVEAVCLSAGLREDLGRAVVVAVDEAVNNVIRHSHRCDNAMTLQIECHLAPNHLEIRLIDEGEPFDLAAVPKLDPSELRIGGRGVYLMRTLMDEVTCEPRGPRGNTLRLIKRW